MRYQANHVYTLQPPGAYPQNAWAQPPAQQGYPQQPPPAQGYPPPQGGPAGYPPPPPGYPPAVQ